MTYVATFFSQTFNFIGVLVLTYILVRVIASAVFKARSKYPVVITQNHIINFELPSISELRRRMMAEVAKKEANDEGAQQEGPKVS